MAQERTKWAELPEGFNPNSYDHIIVAFSGGKDSLACLLHLLDSGVDKSKIELWHHEVDGREGSTLMDWPVTPAYCRAVAKAFDVPIYFSWRTGGFEREMLRDNQATASVLFETPFGVEKSGGMSDRLGTRQKFPQVSADLSVRWCSAYLKIMVCSAAINNQYRFLHKKVLLVTGERAEESKARAHYAVLEEHASTSKKRTVHQWRPVHKWTEQQVWDIIKKFRVNPHPAYKIGFGRVSCMTCIFGSKDQWATVRQISPEKFNRIAAYETRFGLTIQRKSSVVQMADAGKPYESDPADVSSSLDTGFSQPVFLDNWTLPRGAFGDSCGPT